MTVEDDHKRMLKDFGRFRDDFLLLPEDPAFNSGGRTIFKCI